MSLKSSTNLSGGQTTCYTHKRAHAHKCMHSNTSITANNANQHTNAQTSQQTTKQTNKQTKFASAPKKAKGEGFAGVQLHEPIVVANALGKNKLLVPKSKTSCWPSLSD